MIKEGGDFAYKSGYYWKGACIELNMVKPTKLNWVYSSISTSKLNVVSEVTFGALQVGINKVIDSVEINMLFLFSQET